MNQERCPLFCMRPAVVGLTTGAAVVFPIRCALADVMLERLRSSPEHQRLAEALTISPPGDAPRSMFGPDLEPPSPTKCTNVRREQSCGPSFVQILAERGLDTSLPEQLERAPELRGSSRE